MVPLWKSHKKPLKSHWTEMVIDSFPTEASKITTSGLIDEIPQRPTRLCVLYIQGEPLRWQRL